MLLDRYPGYNRAMARAAQIEDYLHDLPFLATLQKIRGISVRQLTPRMCGLLLFVRSPFLYKAAERRVDDVARFLWIVSPDYKPDQKAADRYMRRLPLISATRKGELYPVFRSFCRAIDRYLDRAFIDQPPQMASSNGPLFPVAYEAAIIHPIARAYHWDADRVLDTPIAQVYQFLKLIQRERVTSEGMGVPAFTPFQDRMRRRIVLKWRRRAFAAGFGADVEAYLNSIGAAA